MIAGMFADGGVIGPNPSLIGGTWAWCHVDESGQRIAHASGIVRPFLKDAECQPIPVTNNNTEMIALTRGLLSLPEGWSGTIYSDSRLALGWVFWGFKHEKVPVHLYQKAKSALGRLGSVEVVHLDGHPTVAQLQSGLGKRGNRCSEHNVWCDAECGRRAVEGKQS
jgi:ribonuclease HI